METTVEEKRITTLKFGQKVKPFEKIKGSLPRELTTNPAKLENIGNVVFKVSADIPQNIAIPGFAEPKVITADVILDPDLTTNDRLKWLERLGLRVYLPNRTTFLGLCEIKQEEGITKYVFSKWGKLGKVPVKRILRKELPPQQIGAPLIVPQEEVSKLEFEFNDSAMGRFS